jgi:UDP-glucose 4-epimerase
MTAPLVWVVGAGGLLGSAVWRALGPDAWRPERPFRWQSPAELSLHFQDAVRAFGQRVVREPGRPWVVAWCAGAGVVATSEAALEAETRVLQSFLDLLAADSSLKTARGHVLLASSAGGVYAGSVVCPITEATAPKPISAYGRTKLLQEEILLSWARKQPVSIATLVARFSNLYGPEQRLDKPQGLISHISRCAIHGVPVHVYVPLDTIRDYLFSDDAGRQLVAGLRRLVRESAAESVHVLKVYGSEREISIAGVLGIFRQVARRRLRVVSGLSPIGSLQPRRLQFRSRIWAEDSNTQVELVEGVSRVYARQLACFGRGHLPAPAVRNRVR